MKKFVTLSLIFIILLSSWCSNNETAGKNTTIGDSTNIYEESNKQKIWVTINSFEKNNLSNFNSIQLWALDDHWIADVIWFHDTFWEYFDEIHGWPSMFSCEDSDTERLKGNLKWNCLRYQTTFWNISIISLWLPEFYTSNWKIIWDIYEIANYNLWDYTIDEAIKNSNERLDWKYCIKNHDTWYDYENEWIKRIAGLWRTLNEHLNNNNLVIYDIHEVFNWECWNNNPWMLIHKRWTDQFYTVISTNNLTPFPYRDWIYSTPFSIDIDL